MSAEGFQKVHTATEEAPPPSYDEVARSLAALSRAIGEGKLSPDAAHELRDRILLSQDAQALEELKALLAPEPPQGQKKEEPEEGRGGEQKTEAPAQKEFREQSTSGNVVSFGGFDVRRRESGIQKSVGESSAPADVIQFPAPEPARTEVIEAQRTEVRAEAFNREVLQKEAEEIHQSLHQANPLSFLAHSEYVSGYLGLYEFLQDKYFDRDDLSEEEVRDFSLQMEHLRKMVPVLREKLRLEEVKLESQAAEEIEPRVTVANLSSAIPEVNEREREAAHPPERQQQPRVGRSDIVGKKEQQKEQQEIPKGVHGEARLHTPEVNRMLDELLKDWLGGSGFLGLGSRVGLRHPLFKASQREKISDVLKSDTPPGIVKNAREWERRYGVVPKDQDFETYLREVIVASVEKKRAG